jgi:hypothetical protein
MPLVIIFSNKPSPLNKKLIKFFQINLINLNKASLVFDFEVAHPKDINKYVNKGIKNYPCYNSFLAKITANNVTFEFDELDRKQRHMLYFMSIYYRYIWYTTDAKYSSYHGYETGNKIEEGVEYSYKYLKGHRLYNPELFRLVSNELINPVTILVEENSVKNIKREYKLERILRKWENR